MAKPQPKPAPKLPATSTPPLGRIGEEDHEEELIDEAVADPFPASDPPASAQPRGPSAAKDLAEEGCGTQSAESDPAKKKAKTAEKPAKTKTSKGKK